MVKAVSTEGWKARMTTEELAREVERIKEADSQCRGRTGEFIARTTILQEHQEMWNEKMEACLHDIREKLEALDKKFIRAAAWAAGAGGIVAALGKYALDHLFT